MTPKDVMKEIDALTSKVTVAGITMKTHMTASMEAAVALLIIEIRCLREELKDLRP